MFKTIYLISLCVSIAANLFDVWMTERGLKKGLALEAFDWLVGRTPSFLALALRDSMLIAFAFGPILAISLVNEPVAIGGCAFATVSLARHVRGALNWKRLLDGKPVRVYDHPMSIWEKFWS